MSIASVMLYVGCSSSDSSTSVQEENGSFTQEDNGTFKDPRDGKTYKTVKIDGLDDQVWMAENLNYKMDNSYCYDDDPANCEKYGRLYTWETAKEACPPGWHLPTRGEFETLIANVGGKDVPGKMLKSTTGWEDDDGRSGNGTDAYGFNVLPAGAHDSHGSAYPNAGEGARFWSASEGQEFGGQHLYLNYGDNILLFERGGHGRKAFSSLSPGLMLTHLSLFARSCRPV